MSSFRGQFSHALDKKGRVSIPARYREILRSQSDEQLILSPRDGHLKAYPLLEWERMEENLKRFPKFNKTIEDYKRILFSSAQESVLDAQGRILIPPELRKRAGLKQKVLFVGMIENFEIWNRDLFLKNYEATSENIREIEEKVAEMAEKLGI